MESALNDVYVKLVWKFTFWH